MTENIYQRARSRLSKLSPEEELIAIVIGLTVGYPLAFSGIVYGIAGAIKTYRNDVVKTTEYIANYPYLFAVGAAGITALGISTYKYIERKLHAAETLDDFVDKAKKTKSPLNIEFQHELPVTGGGYYESFSLKAGRVRYNHKGRCGLYSLNEADNSGFGRYPEEGTGLLSILEASINLAETLQKLGLEATVKGKSIRYARDHLTRCQDLFKKGY